MLPRVVSVSEIIAENPYIKTFVLSDTVPGATPGQFVMLWIPGLDEKPIAVVCRDPLTLTIAAVGPFSRALHALKVGDRVGWRGPFGRGFDLQGDGEALLIGGGYGVAALYFCAQELRKQQADITVAIGGRTAQDLVFEERLREMDVRIAVATEDGSRGTRGFVTDAAREALSRKPRVYACGPEAMLVAIMRETLAKNIPAQLSVERHMKCGFGICGQCTLSGKLVCQDGPVFTARELSQLPEFGRVYRDASGAVHFFQGRGARRT
ncbi:MAG: dihydroorotate dehydrogenase electron transfer subunit [Chloroflexi bacterium]|nr:dihydroorotate dehydrogenase electron transfer subunit [Chloroflexota bacterium]